MLWKHDTVSASRQRRQPKWRHLQQSQPCDVQRRRTASSSDTTDSRFLTVPSNHHTRDDTANIPAHNTVNKAVGDSTLCPCGASKSGPPTCATRQVTSRAFTRLSRHTPAAEEYMTSPIPVCLAIPAAQECTESHHAKPEVHTILHHRQRRIELWPQIICRHEQRVFTRFLRYVSRQTQINTLSAIQLPPRFKIVMVWKVTTHKQEPLHQ